jgi:hypothetical protein
VSKPVLSKSTRKALERPSGPCASASASRARIAGCIRLAPEAKNWCRGDSESENAPNLQKGSPASGSCPGKASKLADALHHSGDFTEAMRVFAEAERL